MYTDPSNGHVLLYAGLDRFDNSGDATAGFWFFQNPIGRAPSITTNGGHPFTGTHADGDILLVSDFTQGGSVSTIKVFRWTGNDATGSLVAVATPAGHHLRDRQQRAHRRALVLHGQEPPHQPRGRRVPGGGRGPDRPRAWAAASPTSWPRPARRQSPTATLSDFVIGSFNTCRLDLPNTATVSAPTASPPTTQPGRHHRPRWRYGLMSLD